MVYCIMQYIPDGPDIPEEVEHARRNDKLVLFCGAGISAQSGLPTFKNLVEEVCQKLNIDIKKEPLLNEVWERKQYDSVLDLIEGHQPFSVSRETLRKTVINILEKQGEEKHKKIEKNTQNNHTGKSQVHKALLDLSALPGNKGYRLVTTNFDRLFFEAGLDPALSDSAPKLAPPRKETWKNLTFLHGVIDEKHDPEGNNLILTRKDFGLAYLHDNWAARFVIQLFQDFTVLFIGYGVNDPVMNYLVSAISYENQRRKRNNIKNHSNNTLENKEEKNKTKPAIYAFAGYKEDEEAKAKAKNKWKAIGVEPIPYKIKNNPDHSILYNTIKQWADWKTTGLLNKKTWLKEKLKSPYRDFDKNKEQNIISFLKTDSKLAEYFPQINFGPKEIQKNTLKQNVKDQVTSDTNLDPTQKKDQVTSDTNPNPIQKKDQVTSDTNLDPTQKKDQVTSDTAPDPIQKNKPTNLPSVSTKENELKQHKPVDISWLKPINESRLLDKLIKKTAIPIPPVPQVPLWETPSPTEYCITNWLLHHLDKKELIHWIINQGCILNPLFKYIIRREMEYKETLKDKTQQLEKRILLFWETVTNNNYLTYQPIREYEIDYDIIRGLNQQYCSIKAQKLLEALEPYIHFKPDIHFEPDVSDELLKKKPESKNLIYEAELQINARRYPDIVLQNEKTLLLHAEDFSNLLKKAMEQAKLFNIIKNGEDLFYMSRSSIEQHTHNKRYYPWTYLIDLTRDSFDLSMQQNKTKAHFLLNKWRFYPYSIFYRLIFYAITKYPELKEDIALDLLERNPAHTLWSRTSQNEVFKYLRNRKHSKSAVKKLFALIMKGPPRSLFKDIDENTFIEQKAIDIFKRLDCLKKAEASLPEEINTYYNKIQKKYSLTPPKNKEDDRGDFPYFHTGPIFVGSQNHYHNLTLEQIYDDLKNPKSTLWSEDKTRAFRSLAKDMPDKTFKVLLMFKEGDIEGATYWGAFLNGITEISDIQTSNQHFQKTLKTIENKPDKFINKCLWSLIHAWDLKAGPIYYKDKQYFEKWWKRLWKLSITDTTDFNLDDSNFSMIALNSKSGQLSQSIFQALWSKFDKTIPKNSKIPEEIKNYFNTIINGATKNPWVMFHFGSYLYELWFLDREWTKDNIKPLMDWEQDKHISRALWEGYTYYMHLNPDFLSDFKSEFYKLFLNCQSLYKTGSENYDNENRCLAVADLFLIATGGKWYVNIFKEETKNLKQVLDTELLKSLATQIKRLLKDSGDKSSILWDKKIKSWIKEFWPHQNSKKTPEIAEDLSFIILYCGDKLPEAFKLLEDKIKGVIKKNNYSILYFIEEDINNNKNQMDYIFNHPQELLKLLDWSLPETNTLESYYGNKLKTILNKLKSKHPEIEQDKIYIKLLEKTP